MAKFNKVDGFKPPAQVIFSSLLELDNEQDIFSALDYLGYITYTTNDRLNALENILIHSIKLKQLDVAEYCLNRMIDERRHLGV